MRVLLTVAYDGTSYHGWQVQAHEEMTIEGVLNRAIFELTKEPVAVIGASRTDAGVHAKGNLCVFDTDATIPPDRYAAALNSVLPDDIRIMDSCEVSGDFHPRHVASRKTYCYRFYHGELCPPMERLYRTHVYGPLDLEAMKKAAVHFTGEHDFASFCAAGAQTDTTVRTIYDVRIINVPADGDRSGRDEYIDIYITGNGFLYNMIRIIAGTLLEVARGRMDPGDIPGIISGCDRSLAGPTLAAKGLCLERYEIEGFTGGVLK